MSNVFGVDDVRGITNGVNYNPDTGVYENGNHLEKTELFKLKNKNRILKQKKRFLPMETSTCYQCKSPLSVFSDRENGGGQPSPVNLNDCYDSLACLDPAKNSETSWFNKNCILKCPTHKPYCFSYKQIASGTVLHAERGCTELDEEEEDALHQQSPPPTSKYNRYGESRLDREICREPKYVTTDAMNCEKVCQGHLCNSAPTSRFSYAGLLILLLLFNLLLLQ